MENENKQPLEQVKDLCKYFQINRHATLKAVAFFKSVSGAISCCSQQNVV